MIPNRDICNAFHRCAPDYEQYAVISGEIGERLFERLSYLKIKPNYILDLGCGPGRFTPQLKKLYPHAIVVGLDLVDSMLMAAKTKQTWRKRWPLVRADMHALPFVNGLFDLVFANQVLHWSSHVPQVIAELNRVMHRDGCLMFSMLGLDTFKELQAFSPDAYSAAPQAQAHQLADMHHVGDCLLKEQFLDPVVDMEMLVAHHKSWPSLLQALRAQGVRNIHPERQRGLMGKKRWHAFEQVALASCTPEGKFPLTYEVIYGHAWKGDQRRTEQGIETFVPVSMLRTRR